MKDKVFQFLLFLFLSSAFGCKKDPTKNAALPPATQDGKNTIGFTLNGEVWAPYAKCAPFSDPCRELLVRYGEAGGGPAYGIDFSFTRKRNGKTSGLAISSTLVGTITSVGEKVDSIGVTFIDENSVGNLGYYTGPLTGSKFIITKIDFSAGIISGNFDLELIDGYGNKTSLKDGRFDFRLNTCHCSN